MERVLGTLPPGLHEQAKRLTFDIGLRYSATGAPRDAFTGVDTFPLFSIGGWLLDDLAPATGPRAKRTEIATRAQGLFLIAVLGAMAAEALREIDDPGGVADPRASANTALWCSARIAEELRRLVPADHGFWDMYTDLVVRESEISMGIAPKTRGRWSYPASVAALAAVAISGATEDKTDSVLSMVDQLGSASEIWAQLGSIHQDLLDGTLTYPIAVACELGGIPIEPDPPVFEVLGALVATGALGVILHEASTRLDASRGTASALHLRTIEGFVAAGAAADSRRTAELLAHGPVAAPTSGMNDPRKPTLERAIAMAEGYLLADTTFRESWETHREGMLGAEEVSARFPAGLIAEILCRRGHDLTGAVDEFIANADAGELRYYDHPGSDPDADTLGIVLRLLEYSSRPEPSARAAELLDCVDAMVARGEPIPVWLAGCDALNDQRPPTVALGERCGTVVAHLLLGIAATRSRERTLNLAANALLDRVAAVGLGVNINYPHRYALRTFLLLTRHVRHERARRVLEAELERRRNVSSPGAQEAALGVLAALAARSADLIEHRSIEKILRLQRFDGSWIGEPFAVAPTRGWRVSAYSSTTLTTALCYDALVGFELGV